MNYVILTFKNMSANKTVDIRTRLNDAFLIARWYGAYHANDEYDIILNGKLMNKDINGEIIP